MCGIVGLIDFSSESSEHLLLQMTNTLEHRGPDGVGTKSFQNKEAFIGLGHRRLSILELSDLGKQPMQFNSWWITFNGEVYNFSEIRKKLISLGHTFTSNSDTEVILHAYQEWEEACLSEFIGMFAFCIYNQETDHFFIARDRTGVKPLYYTFQNDLFIFGSELKALTKHPKFKKTINKHAVAAFMQFGNVPQPHCIFENTFKLKAGHYLKFSLTDDLSNLHQQCYWSVYEYYNKPNLEISYPEAKAQTHKLLKDAFQLRMVSDVPVGVFLSGGYDSACVAAILQKDREEKLKTFTIGVPDIGLNEAPYAKDVAQYLGTEHSEYMCSEKEATELINKLPYYFDEPFADSSAIPTMLVSLMAKKEVTVALSADGGDEIFAGYNRYDFISRYQSKLQRLPKIVRKTSANLMDVIPSNALPIVKHKYNFHNRYEKLKGLLRDPSNENIMLSVSQQFTQKQLQQLFSHSITELDTAYASKKLNKEASALSYMMAIDYETYLHDDILQKVDRATMFASLEGREPFLDHRIIEFAAQLPDHFKYHSGVKKRIIKDIVHDYIPQEMMDRPKMGFAIPIANWMYTILRELVESHLNQEKIERQAIFNWNFVARLKSNLFSGKKELDTKIWYLLMFQMWYDEHLL
ncbi:MAG: asparagine synthase (glutamine-hydrolyzing) [Lishizhenia sp.]